MADRDVIAGRYRLDAEIGSGGMGEVWRATDRETGATVAPKRVRLSHLAPGERDRARERLRAEAGQADEVHVCVGGDDQWVSKKHGRLEHTHGRWIVHATGRRPIRLPTGELFTGAAPVPLEEGYTPLFVLGGGNRQHLLEVYVVGGDGQRPAARHDHETMSPPVWPLTDGGWRTKSVEHRVVKVRQRLHKHGVFGLVASEVPRPIGNQLNDHLLRELIRSATLVPTDLHRLDDWADG